MRTRIAYNQLYGYDNVLPTEVCKFSDNELSYIFCDGCLSNSTYKTYKDDLKLWVSKLRLGGRINIVGIDARSICVKYITSNDLAQINSVIENHKLLLNYQDIESVLIELGLKIESINLNGVYYNIEAIR